MSESLAKNLKIDALIFDVDGVLIDVSKSYRQAIIQTVDLFFNYALGLAYEGEPQPLIDNHDIDLLKQAGGFNNDWALTSAFIAYYLEMLPPHSVITMPLKKHVPAMLAYLQVVGSSYRVTIEQLLANKSIDRLARGISDLGGGLAALSKLLKRRNRHLLSTGGSLLEGNLVQRTFQELYLGESLFKQVYNTPAVVVQRSGLINNETLLIDPAVLTTLSGHISLGIATGRPKVEAEYSLKRLNIDRYFQSLVTHDDVETAKAKGKPHPWSLLEAARRIRPLPARSAYIGDTLDDVLAAKAANETVPFVAIGSLAVAQDKDNLRRRFEEQRADIVLGHPNGLKDLILR
jgi:HAD superfamily hydrolase (TIGR01548 family)